MSFFQKMQNALIRFMYGRNGFDQLNRFLFWVVLILDIASIFLARGESPLGGILSLVVTAAWLLLLFRTFSRNLATDSLSEKVTHTLNACCCIYITR